MPKKLKTPVFTAVFVWNGMKRKVCFRSQSLEHLRLPPTKLVPLVKQVVVETIREHLGIEGDIGPIEWIRFDISIPDQAVNS